MHFTRTILLTLLGIAGAASCNTPPKDRLQGPLPAGTPLDQVTILKRSDDRLPPTDPDDVEIEYRPGFRLTAEGEPFLGTHNQWVMRYTGAANILGSLQYATLEPAHERAVIELRRSAASMGADRLIDVGYTLHVGEESDGGARILAWAYHGRAAAADDTRESTEQDR